MDSLNNHDSLLDRERRPLMAEAGHGGRLQWATFTRRQDDCDYTFTSRLSRKPFLPRGAERDAGIQGGMHRGCGACAVVRFGSSHVRGRLLGKSGGIGGFMTYVVLSPNRKLGIFIAASRVNFAMLEGLRSGVRELAAELAPAGP
jgi:CubicO group peptidase (beta-lactamase class C family)